LQQAGFKQPDWPLGKGHAKVPIVQINGKPDRATDAVLVTKSEIASLENAILKIRLPQHAYRVNYSGSIPNFANK